MEGLKREDFGQNMGVFRGVYQGPNGCLWLVSSRLPWQGQGDMYFIQRQAQAMKRLCGPLATQLARALGKPIDYAASGVPGDTEAILALVMKGGRDILAFHSKWNKFIFVSKAGNHGVVSMYNAADETLGHFEALVPENCPARVAVKLLVVPGLAPKGADPPACEQVLSGGRILTKMGRGSWYDEHGFALRMPLGYRPKSDVLLPVAPFRVGQDSPLVQDSRAPWHVGLCGLLYDHWCPTTPRHTR